MSTSSAAPRSEYRQAALTVSGRDVGVVEIVAREMMGGDVADSSDDLVAVISTLVGLAKASNVELRSIEDLARLDLSKLLATRAIREAVFNLAARTIGEPVSFVRALDTESLLRVVTASVEVNAPFFSMLPSLLGLGRAAASGSATPKAVA